MLGTSRLEWSTIYLSRSMFYVMANGFTLVVNGRHCVNIKACLAKMPPTPAQTILIFVFLSGPSSLVLFVPRPGFLSRKVC